SDRDPEDLEWLLGRVLVPDLTRLPVEVERPDGRRPVRVVAVVRRLVPFAPAHNAGLVLVGPKAPAEERGRFHPDDLLVVEDLEFLPDLRDQGVPLVGVPAIDRRVRARRDQDVSEEGAEEALGVLDLDLLVDPRPVLPGAVRTVGARVVDEVRRARCTERSRLAVHEARHVLRVRGVAAKKAMRSENVELARLRDGLLRRLFGSGVLSALGTL